MPNSFIIYHAKKYSIELNLVEDLVGSEDSESQFHGASVQRDNQFGKSADLQDYCKHGYDTHRSDRYFMTKFPF